MRYFILSFLLMSITSFAQDIDSKSILLPVNDLFNGMEKGDSSMVRSAFYRDAMFITVVEKDGDVSLRREKLQSFLIAVSSPRAEQWHEPIWNVKIDREGNFAQVWASYAFYLGNKFSHCGIDTFQLIRTVDGWKIFYLADTRKKTGCEVPEEIDKQYSSK